MKFMEKITSLEERVKGANEHGTSCLISGLVLLSLGGWVLKVKNDLAGFMLIAASVMFLVGSISFLHERNILRYLLFLKEGRDTIVK